MSLSIYPPGRAESYALLKATAMPRITGVIAVLKDVVGKVWNLRDLAEQMCAFTTNAKRFMQIAKSDKDSAFI